MPAGLVSHPHCPMRIRKAYHRIGSVHYVASATSEKGVDTYVKIWKAGLPTLDVRRPRAQLGIHFPIAPLNSQYDIFKQASLTIFPQL